MSTAHASAPPSLHGQPLPPEVAEAIARTGLPSEQVRQLCRAVEMGATSLEELWRPSAAQADAVESAALQFYRQGHYLWAAALYTFLTEAEAQRATAWRGLGASCLALGEVDRAAVYLQQAVMFDIGDAVAMMLLGEALLRAGFGAQARAVLEEGVALAGNQPQLQRSARRARAILANNDFAANRGPSLRPSDLRVPPQLADLLAEAAAKAMPAADAAPSVGPSSWTGLADGGDPGPFPDLPPARALTPAARQHLARQLPEQWLAALSPERLEGDPELAQALAQLNEATRAHPSVEPPAPPAPAPEPFALDDAALAAMSDDEIMAHPQVQRLYETLRQGVRRQQITLKDVAGFSEEQLQGLYGAACQLLQVGQPVEALEMAGWLLFYDARSGRYWELTGVIAQHMGLPCLADYALGIALIYAPNEPSTLLYRGEAKIHSMERNLGRQLVEQALGLFGSERRHEALRQRGQQLLALYPHETAPASAAEELRS